MKMAAANRILSFLIFLLLASLAFPPAAQAATNTFNFSTTSLAASTGPLGPVNGVTSISGSTLSAGDVVVLDCLVVNVNETESDNWGAVELNQNGGYLGITAATLGVLARTGTSTPCALYVNGVAKNFTGSTAAITNRVRIELYISATGSTTNLGYYALIDVGATGNSATI